MRRPSVCAGFQLIELAIVLAVVVALSGWGAAAFQGMAEAYRLDHSARRFVSELSAWRCRAVSGNRSVSVRIGEAGDSFAFAPPGESPVAWYRLESGVRFTAQPGRPVTFFSRGSAVPAGSFVLSSRRGRIKVIVAGGGRVRWETL